MRVNYLSVDHSRFAPELHMRLFVLLAMMLVFGLCAPAFAQPAPEPNSPPPPAPQQEAPDEVDAEAPPEGEVDDQGDADAQAVGEDEEDDEPLEGSDRALERAARRGMRVFTPAPQADDAPPVVYYLPSGDDAPQLDVTRPIACVYRPGMIYPLRLQCDEPTKTCLAAEEAMFREVKAPGEPSRWEPTRASVAHLSPCATSVSPDELALAMREGVVLIPARLDAPYGYKREARGRAFQTHFDLRSRLALSAAYTVTSGLGRDGARQSITIDTRASYEGWTPERQRRHRFRFVEGELTLDPLLARGLVFDYETARTSDEPLLWITTLIGAPRRFDVFLNLSFGATLGRFDYRTVGDQTQAFLDLAEARIGWEILQGPALEDYLAVRLGAGVGTRRYAATDAGALYVYPELSLRGAWLIGARGLGQLSVDARARYGYEPDTQAAWTMLSASAMGEWVVVALNDQPISLFVQPELQAMSFPEVQLSQRDVRVMAGLRLSLFVPAPPSPASLSQTP